MQEKYLNDPPEVSIVMPVFNGERFLREALDSLLSQTFTNFELRISDNASTDSTPNLCLEYASKDSRIIYHRQDKNLGAFCNAEWLFRAAKGEFLMLVGDDDVYEKDCLARYVEKMHSHQDLILVYSDYGWIDSHGNRSISGLKCFMNAEDEIATNLRKFIRANLALPLMMGLFRTDAVVKAVPFPNFGKNYKNFSGSRDIGFLWNILPRGRVDSINTPLFYYRNKERGHIIPAEWGHNQFIIKRLVINLNLIILLRHVIPQVWASKIKIDQRVGLIIWAFVIFVAQYSIIPILQTIREYAKSRYWSK